METIKSIGAFGVMIVVIILLGATFGFFMKGSAWIFENYYGLFQSITNWVWGVVILLVILSVIPTIRIFTGLGIHYATYIWGAFFWLFCLFVTYELWGFFGIFLGLIMAGVGIFITAFLAVLFEGEVSVALMMALNLAIIYGIRMLGYWIATKHKERENEKEISITTDNSINTTL
jgi:hypothetical protein